MSSAWLSTASDARMLSMSIASSETSLDMLPVRRGESVARELAGRPLFRYVDERHAKEVRHPGPVFVTPTPYQPDELQTYLALTGWPAARTFVLRLDPLKLSSLRGPRWCDVGIGVEYILLRGYEPEAVIDPDGAVEIR